MLPDPSAIHPIPGFDGEIYVKPTLKNPRILVGDFTYIADSDFERHVTHHYEWLGDRLVIGKFCQIGTGVEFVMNGANHQLNAATTYPFFTIQGWDAPPPPLSSLPLKGDTVVGNDVWIGQDATILPGVRIGDGAIVGARSVVSRDVPPYAVVAGNPARLVRQRFDDTLAALLLRFRWWDLPVSEIKAIVPVLTSPDLDALRAFLESRLQ